MPKSAHTVWVNDWKHLETAGAVIVAEHPGDCEEVRVLPGKQNRKEHPRTQVNSAGSRDALAFGALNNSPEGLRVWIKSPDQFKPGVLMPAMNLKDTELDQLVAYLTTLK